MTDYLDPANYRAGKTGPQFQWLDERLTVHGYPLISYGDTFLRRVKQFQEAQGWTGTGADGYVGPKTLKLLSFDPEPDEPSGSLDLTGWKWTGPYGDDEDPIEVRQPELDTFENAPWFDRRPDGIAFRANHGGVTTSGSGNPRSELREMTADGSDEYEWDARSRRHVLDVELAVTHLTNVRPYVVLAQIHDADDDVTVWRLEGTSLWLTKGDKAHGKLVTATFGLNQRVRLGFDVYDGLVHFMFNGKPIDGYTVAAGAGNYFKTGCYLQSNPSTAPGESSDAYGEVVVYSLEVTHT